MQDIASLDIVGRLASVVLKLFIPPSEEPSTTSENIWLSRYHHNDQH